MPKISALDTAAALDGSELAVVVQSGQTVKTTTQDIADLGGGGAGVPRLIKFDFAYDTPGLAAGVEVLTPTPGDVLLDAWIAVDVAFNGTTPKADIGPFSTGAADGIVYWYNEYFPLDATVDTTSHTVEMMAPYQSLSIIAMDYVHDGNGAYPYQARFTTTDPLKLIANQTGHIGGDPIGGSAGAASLYLLIASPVSLNP